MTIVTDFSYSKYIVVSSMFFQIPAYYGYHHSLYYHALASCLTSIFSINYWRDARHSWRRDMDIHWARGAGACYFIHGMRYTTLGIPACMLMLFFYYQSCSKYEQDKLGSWYLYHMVFHGIAASNQFIAMHYILNQM